MRVEFYRDGNCWRFWQLPYRATYFAGQQTRWSWWRFSLVFDRFRPVTAQEVESNDWDGMTCDFCGEPIGPFTSHYHCPNCGEECSKSGHIDATTNDYTCAFKPNPLHESMGILKAVLTDEEVENRLDDIIKDYRLDKLSVQEQAVIIANLEDEIASFRAIGVQAQPA